MKKQIIVFTLAMGAILATPVDCVIDGLDTFYKTTKSERQEKVREKPALQLYVKYNCPYCRKVLAFLKDRNIEVEIKNASQKENASYLLANGKKRQVPCLFVDDKAIYESDDIISFLIENQ